MRKSVASRKTAVPLILALAMFAISAISASIGPATRAQTSLECPATFERLRSELNDADEADSTGFNNHYWAVVVNREGLVCAVAYSGRDRDSQWLLSRQIAAAKAFTANGLSLDTPRSQPHSSIRGYSRVRRGIRCSGWRRAILSIRAPRTRATTISSGRATIRWSGDGSAARSPSAAGLRSTLAATSSAASASPAIRRAAITRRHGACGPTFG